MLKPLHSGPWTRPAAVAAALVLFGTGCRPPGPTALLKGEALLKEGKVAEAVVQLEKAIRYRDLETTAQAWNHLGVAYHRHGQGKKAEQSYQRALLLDRNLAAARLNLGYLYLESGNHLAAADAFTTYCTLKPDLPEAWLRLGQAQVRAALASPASERTRLLEAARRNLEYAPAGAEKLNLLGQIAFLRGRYRDAHPLFTAAVQADPAFAPAILNLAICYQQLGDRRAALIGYRDYLGRVTRSADTLPIEAAAATLEAELNPPAAVAPLAVPASTPIAAPIVSNPPVRPPPQPTTIVPQPSRQTNAAAPVRPATRPVVAPEPAAKPTPKPTASAPVSTPAPLKNEPPVTVVPVAEPPSIRAAEAKAPTDPAPAPAESASTEPTYNLDGLTNFPTRPKAQPSDKKGFFSRLNPTGWFGGGDDAKPAAKPLTAPVLSSPAAPAPVEPAASASPAPTFPRYPYPVKQAPKAGDRSAAQALFNSGLEAHRIRRESAAVVDYTRAIAADPTLFEAHFNLSLAYQTLQEIPNALRAAETAVLIRPQSPEARLQFAQLLDQAGYADDSADQARQTVALKEANPQAHLLLGHLYARKLLNAPQARVHYQRFLELDPQNPAGASVRHWLATTR